MGPLFFAHIDFPKQFFFEFEQWGFGEKSTTKSQVVEGIAKNFLRLGRRYFTGMAEPDDILNFFCLGS